MTPESHSEAISAPIESGALEDIHGPLVTDKAWPMPQSKPVDLASSSNETVPGDELGAVSFDPELDLPSLRWGSHRVWGKFESINAVRVALRDAAFAMNGLADTRQPNEKEVWGYLPREQGRTPLTWWQKAKKLLRGRG